ncbi:MAG: response regulator [Candidatus Omnitrophica bacterium]|nr:response regulator [Candidatus Omnitrophota bacterium]
MPKTILIVDDEEIVVDITKRKLTQEGFFVIGVNDGEMAIQALNQGLVDLILLDVEMPKMNGYTFMNERKKIPGAENIPVIVLTAYDSMEPIFRRNNVQAYLTKPLQFQEVLDKVNEIIGVS